MQVALLEWFRGGLLCGPFLCKKMVPSDGSKWVGLVVYASHWVLWDEAGWVDLEHSWRRGQNFTSFQTNPWSMLVWDLKARPCR